uniref:Protein kinase domain-containing protein n=1 Tax=Macrostomum lignano TaxID=282301 RepID=A0A1I8FNV4_9PLAT
CERATPSTCQTNTKVHQPEVLVASTSLEGGGGTGGSVRIKRRRREWRAAAAARRPKAQSAAGAPKECWRRIAWPGGSSQAPISALPSKKTERSVHGATREEESWRFLRSVRELIERGDQCFIAGTCGFFRVLRSRPRRATIRCSGGEELRSLSRTSHQNISARQQVPRVCWRTAASAWILTIPRAVHLRGVRRRRRPSGPPSRKESRGSGEHLSRNLFTADRRRGVLAGEPSACATATATAAPTRRRLRQLPPLASWALATRIWCSTRDTASSLLQFREQTPDPVQEAAQHRTSAAPESQHQHQHQHQHQAPSPSRLMLARQVAKHGGSGEPLNRSYRIRRRRPDHQRVYRVQASKRRVPRTLRPVRLDRTSRRADAADRVCAHRLRPASNTDCSSCQTPCSLASCTQTSSRAGRDGGRPPPVCPRWSPGCREPTAAAGALFHHLARKPALVFAPTVLRRARRRPSAASGTASLSEVLDYAAPEAGGQGADRQRPRRCSAPLSSLLAPSCNRPTAVGGAALAVRRSAVPDDRSPCTLNSRVERPRRRLRSIGRLASSFSSSAAAEPLRSAGCRIFDDIDVDEAGDCDGGEALDAGGRFSGLRRRLP